MQVYESKPLGTKELRSRAPAIFQTNKHEARSDRYVHVPTYDLLKSLEGEGWLPCAATQSNIRSATVPSMKAFTRHQVSLRQFDDKSGVVPMVTLVNSHNGRCAVSAFAGMFRQVCSNGMCVGKTIFGMSQNHLTEFDFIEGEFERVVEEAGKLVDYHDDWQAIPLTRDKQLEFASEASQLRGTTGDVDPQDLLLRKRDEDEQNDLWTTYNVIQEHVVRGGYMTVTDTGRIVTPRSIESGPSANEVNAKLFEIAGTYAKAA